MPAKVRRVISPKRRIERVRCDILNIMANVSTKIVLHTAEDSQTLVRTLIDLEVSPNANAAVATHWEVAFGTAPRGIQVVTVPDPAVQVLDQVVPTEEITRFRGYMQKQNIIGDAVHMHRFFRDIKAMRKMKQNDSLELYTIVGADTEVKLTGTIYMWFKE